MPRARTAQLNVRSAFARARVRQLAQITGMTATQVVEDALRAYAPASAAPGVLERRGRILVIPATSGPVSLEEANAALQATRERDGGD